MEDTATRVRVGLIECPLASQSSLPSYKSVPYAIDECLALSPTNVFLEPCRKGTVGQLLDGGGKLLCGFTIVLGLCLQLSAGPYDWSPNRSSGALIISPYIAPLVTPRRTLEAWSYRAASRCVAFTQGAH
jgi:hypothetical protein